MNRRCDVERLLDAVVPVNNDRVEREVVGHDPALSVPRNPQKGNVSLPLPVPLRPSTFVLYRSDEEETMHFGYTIVYVPDVKAATDFYSAAFGFTLRFNADDWDYAELETGDTTLAFA